MINNNLLAQLHHLERRAGSLKVTVLYLRASIFNCVLLRLFAEELVRK